MNGTRKRILRVIEMFTAANGYPPTVRELGDLVGLSPTSTHFHLRKLRDAGLVAWRPGQMRTLALTDPTRHNHGHREV